SPRSGLVRSRRTSILEASCRRRPSAIGGPSTRRSAALRPTSSLRMTPFYQSSLTAHQSSRNHHHLAELLTAGQIFVRGAGLPQRKGAVHHWLQFAGKDVLEYLVQLAHCAHVGAQQRELAREQEAQIEVAFRASGRSASNQRAAEFQRLQALLPGGLPDVLEVDVHSAFVGDAPHLVANFLLVMVDGVVGAKPARLLELALIARGGNDFRREHLANL